MIFRVCPVKHEVTGMVFDLLRHQGDRFSSLFDRMLGQKVGEDKC